MAVNIEALKRIADYIAGKYGVRVVFNPDAKTASTSIETRIIELPTFIPDKLRDAVIGLVDHEAGHLKFTDCIPDGIRGGTAKFWVLNVLEDIRINERLNVEYPNYINLLSHFFNLLYADGKKWDEVIKNDEGAKKKGLKANVGKKQITLIFYGNNYTNVKPPPGFTDAFMANKKFWDTIIAGVKKAPDVTALVPFVEQVYKELFGEEPKVKPPDKPGDKPKPPKGDPGPEGDDEGGDDGEPGDDEGGDDGGDSEPGKDKPGKDGDDKGKEPGGEEGGDEGDDEGGPGGDGVDDDGKEPGKEKKPGKDGDDKGKEPGKDGKEPGEPGGEEGGDEDGSEGEGDIEGEDEGGGDGEGKTDGTEGDKPGKKGKDKKPGKDGDKTAGADYLAKAKDLIRAKDKTTGYRRRVTI